MMGMPMMRMMRDRHMGGYQTCGCPCGEHSLHEGRHFLSKEERKGMLQEYREDLAAEIKAVEEEEKAL